MDKESTLVVTVVPNPNEMASVQEYLHGVLPLLMGVGSTLVRRLKTSKVVNGRPAGMVLVMDFESADGRGLCERCGNSVHFLPTAGLSINLTESTLFEANQIRYQVCGLAPGGRMSTLAPLLTTFRNTIPSRDPSGIAETGVPGVLFFWIDENKPRSPLLYDTGIVIVGQGYKEGFIGGRQFRYDADSCLVLGVPVPFECASYGTPDEPLLGVRLDVDLGMLHSLVARFSGKLGADSQRAQSVHSGVEPLRMDGPLLAAVARLLQSLTDPMDRAVVGPAAVEEIVYRILRSEHGRVLHALTRHQTPYANIAQALELIHADYANGLSVEDLAREAAMGVSSFHRAFKEVTGETPLQYLKKVRLLKAKNLLVFEGKRVEETAYDVGYASPSQFSRDFKRYFAVPPSEARTLPYSDGLQTSLQMV